MSESDPLKLKTLGFIGLGAMGKPMVTHLANKLPAGSQIYVYDVVEAVVDEMVSNFPERVYKASSAKNVAEQVVCTSKPKMQPT
jgi:3-hydroxyisobutyrate dehydrogenase-like beta-hydroxyacid dehydrogenase